MERRLQRPLIWHRRHGLCHVLLLVAAPGVTKGYRTALIVTGIVICVATYRYFASSIPGLWHTLW